MVDRKNRAHEIWYSCQVEVTTFSSPEIEYITVCHRSCGSEHCGFHGFCTKCDKRFICATERK